jgi:transposase
MWIYRTGKIYTDTPIVLYEYQRTRKADHPREFLKVFAGMVVCDGYSAYRKLNREKSRYHFCRMLDTCKTVFFGCIKSSSESSTKNAKDTVTYEVLKQIGAIYYLAHDLTVLKKRQDDTDYSFIEELLPWSYQLPEICRSKSKTTNV